MTDLRKDTQPLQALWMVLFSIIILHSIMPIVGRVISSFLTTYFLLLVVLAIIGYFIIWKNHHWPRTFISLIIIQAINVAYAYTHGQQLVTSIYGALLSFCPVLIALRIKSLPNYQIKTLFTLTSVGVLITMLTSIRGLSAHQGIARTLATISTSDDPISVMAGWLNIGGYQFTYLLVTIYPIVIGFVRGTYNRLWLKIALFCLFATYFYAAEYMTALIGFVLNSFLWFIPKNFSHKRLFILLGIALAMSILFKDSVANIMYDSANTTDSSVLQARFQYMADDLSGTKNTSDVGAREDALMISFNGILHYPIWGNWDNGGRIGGHSFIMDFISLYGLIGLILLFNSYKIIYHQFYSQYKNTPYYTYALMSFITAIILSIVNTGNHWIELTLFVPLMLRMIIQIKATRG